MYEDFSSCVVDYFKEIVFIEVVKIFKGNVYVI